MTQKFGLIAATMVLATAGAGCGSSSSTSASASTTSSTAAAKTGATKATATKPVSGHATVAIRNYMYAPMHLTVTAGTKVSFHNDDQTAHTATAINGAFDSGTVAPGKTRSVTLKKPGTYAYHCLFHEFMTATITVVPAHS
jgi:plastocyanin